MSPRLSRPRLSMRSVGFLLAVALVALGVAFRSLDAPHAGVASPASASGSSPAAGAATPSTAPSPGPTIDKDTFCASYADFADAYNVAITTSAAPSLLDRLQQTADAFRAVGHPDDMGPMEEVGRDLFVADTLTAAVSRPTSTAGTCPPSSWRRSADT